MTWHDDHKDSRTFGERAADLMRNGMGSWVFVFAFLGFMGIWMATGGLGIDVFPFILLNLLLSTLAALSLNHHAAKGYRTLALLNPGVGDAILDQGFLLLTNQTNRAGKRRRQLGPESVCRIAGADHLGAVSG